MLPVCRESVIAGCVSVPLGYGPSLQRECDCWVCFCPTWIIIMVPVCRGSVIAGCVSVPLG